MATSILYPRANRPGDETDLTTPFSAEDKNEWSYSSTSPYALMAYTDSSLYLYLHLQVK
jgi:hypothetical protein